MNFKINLDKKFLARASLYILNITLILLALNFLSNNFPLVDEALLRISTIYLLLSLLIFNLPIKKIFYNLKEKHEEKNSFYTLLIGIFLVLFSFILQFVIFIIFLYSN